MAVTKNMLTKKSRQYSSFKLIVPKKNKETFMDMAVLPTETVINSVRNPPVTARGRHSGCNKFKALCVLWLI